MDIVGKARKLEQRIAKTLDAVVERAGAFPSAQTGVAPTAPATVAALKRFQSYHGLPETGVLDKPTWDAAARSFNAYYNHPDYTS
jgi:murein L,D-transpeptidase YcbB/YkuD